MFVDKRRESTAHTMQPLHAKVGSSLFAGEQQAIGPAGEKWTNQEERSKSGEVVTRDWTSAEQI